MCGLVNLFSPASSKPLTTAGAEVPRVKPPIMKKGNGRITHVRLRPILYAKLVAAAEENGRRVGQEIDFRLELSFLRDADLLFLRSHLSETNT